MIGFWLVVDWDSEIFKKWAEYKLNPLLNLKLPKPKPAFWKPGPLLWKNSNGIILEQGGSVVFAHIQSFLTFGWKNI